MIWEMITLYRIDLRKVHNKGNLECLARNKPLKKDYIDAHLSHNALKSVRIKIQDIRRHSHYTIISSISYFPNRIKLMITIIYDLSLVISSNNLLFTALSFFDIMFQAFINPISCSSPLSSKPSLICCFFVYS